jgi:hypothetical protein
MIMNYINDFLVQLCMNYTNCAIDYSVGIMTGTGGMVLEQME